MRLFYIPLLNNNLTNRKSRIGNNLETSETLWSALFLHRFKYLDYKDIIFFKIQKNKGIRGNLYMQYFLGLDHFVDTPIFDPSLFRG